MKKTLAVGLREYTLSFLPAENPVKKDREEIGKAKKERSGGPIRNLKSSSYEKLQQTKIESSCSK